MAGCTTVKLRMENGLPFLSASVEYEGRLLELKNVLVDTGSAGTMFSIDELLKLGLSYEPDDKVQRIRGVGGSEFVFTKRLDVLAVGSLQTRNFSVQVGAMDYGFSIDGIVGVDFLVAVGAVIDMGFLEVRNTA
jgi:hypothetical protein